jgi:DNA-binding response OmpR family regulator
MTPKKILIVEDEKPMANALDLKLRSAGFETTLVYDGQSAVNAAQASRFDLIILDLVLPKKDGFFVLDELKKLKITTPVIVSSNLSQDEDIKRAHELGATGYFIKSDTTLAEIVEKIKRATGTNT